MAKGIQPIVLTRWSNGSLDRLAGVIKAYSGKTFEIGCMPFFNHGQPFKQLQYLLHQITGAGPRIRLTIHLSFHRDDARDTGTLKTRAGMFNDFLLAHQGVADISVTPMLEDDF